jgi:hypothetical protein
MNSLFAKQARYSGLAVGPFGERRVKDDSYGAVKRALRLWARRNDAFAMRIEETKTGRTVYAAV